MNLYTMNDFNRIFSQEKPLTLLTKIKNSPHFDPNDKYFTTDPLLQSYPTKEDYMKTQFLPINSIVHVCDWGKEYTTYTDFFKKNPAYYHYLPAYTKVHPTGMTDYKIVGYGIHSYFSDIRLYILEDINKNIYLVEEKGIETF